MEVLGIGLLCCVLLGICYLQNQLAYMKKKQRELELKIEKAETCTPLNPYFKNWGDSSVKNMEAIFKKTKD